MELDPILLSRIQFAFTVMFHYLFPPMTIGLGVLLVYMEWMYLRTKDPIYEGMTKFWVKIFALNFAIGVASGIVMEFQFGTNWATYSRYVGDVFGSALAAEGIFAFFLESGFLAILVFGWDRVTPKVHFFSTIMVALGSIFSAVWIVVANSWQQTPAGYHIVGEGIFQRAEITDFWAVVFNPSSMARLSHVLVGSFIVGAFFVMSVCAYYILTGRHQEFARRAFKIALVYGACASILQLAVGHWSGQVAAKYQPAKMAAFEGVFETEPYSPLHLFGIPNTETGQVDYGIAIPGMLSFLVHDSFSEPVTGLNDIPRDEWPPVNASFQFYHIMVALGFYFIAITFYGLFLMWRGTLFQTRWLLRLFVLSVIFPYIANQAGWVATEIGRQPWVVYGLLRTADSVSKSVDGTSVLISLIMFGFIYLLLLILFLYVLDKKIRTGPEIPGEEPPKGLSPTTFFDAVASRGKTQHSMVDPQENN